MKPEDVPEALKEYLATTMRSDKPYEELTVEEKFGEMNSRRSVMAYVSRKFRAELYAARKSQQHPLYKTSGGDYGVVPKGITHKVELPKHAKKGKFSKVCQLPLRSLRVQA